MEKTIVASLLLGSPLRNLGWITFLRSLFQIEMLLNVCSLPLFAGYSSASRLYVRLSVLYVGHTHTCCVHVHTGSISIEVYILRRQRVVNSSGTR